MANNCSNDWGQGLLTCHRVLMTTMISYAAKLYPYINTGQTEMNAIHELRMVNGIPLPTSEVYIMHPIGADWWELFLFAPLVYKDGQLISETVKTSKGQFAEPVHVKKRQYICATIDSSETFLIATERHAEAVDQLVHQSVLKATPIHH